MTDSQDGGVRILCKWFHVHKWGQWRRSANHLKQEKWCLACNKKRTAYYLGGE